MNSHGHRIMKKIFVSTISGFLALSGLLLASSSQSVAIDTEDFMRISLPIELPNCPLTLTPSGVITHVCPGDPIPTEPSCPLSLTIYNDVTDVCLEETTTEPYSEDSYQNLF
jgi:hypothetical protein